MAMPASMAMPTIGCQSTLSGSRAGAAPGPLPVTGSELDGVSVAAALLLVSASLMPAVLAQLARRVEGPRRRSRSQNTAGAGAGRAISRPVGEILEVYRRTRKSRDLVFNSHVCRPIAAVFVVALRGTRFTPNQVSFFSLLLAWCAAALLVWLPGRAGWWLGVLVLELSYVFDCVDGMLARERGVASQAGHLLDFLMDEIKAFFVLGAVALGAYRREGDPELLIWGVVGLVSLASGIGLTTFQRRPEIVAVESAHPENRQGRQDSPRIFLNPLGESW